MLIANSEAYFKITNSKFYNAGSESVDAGIYLCNTKNGQLINNDCSNNNRHGILLIASSQNEILINTANNNKFGIGLLESNDNYISGNDAYNNGRYGILLEVSNDNDVLNNDANDNGDAGISLDTSSYNVISKNTASNNGEYGIKLLYSSNFNLVSENTAIDNQYDIAEGESCEGNTIENNGDSQIFSVDDIEEGDDDDDDDNDKDKKKGKDDKNESEANTIPGYDVFILITACLLITSIICKRVWKKLKQT